MRKAQTTAIGKTNTSSHTVLTYLILWCVVSRTPGRGLLETYLRLVLWAAIKNVCTSAACLSDGFPPVLSWYYYLLSGNYLSSFFTFLRTFFLSLSYNNFFELRFLSQYDSFWQPVPCLNYSDSKGFYFLQ